jgi:GT2 family glycosyltransferase
MDINNLIPKVLIAAPTSNRHSHIIDKWIAHLNSFTYPNFDVCLVDNSLNSDTYFKKLQNSKIKDKSIITWQHKWNIKEKHPLQMLANVREEIRQYFIAHKEYEFLWWLDDDIFVPKNSIQRLVSYNKDHVGFYVPVFYKPNRVPCILKSGDVIVGKGLEYYSFKELRAYKEFADKFKSDKLTEKEKLLIPFIIKDKWHPNLFKTYGVNLGCLMVKRNVVEAVPFRTHPTFIWGEDCWYFAEANDKKFEFWCDVSVKVRHENTDWTIINKNSRELGFFIAIGPVTDNLKGADIVIPNKK